MADPRYKSERNEAVYGDRESGMTLEEIAAKYSVTRERIRQIVAGQERRARQRASHRQPAEAYGRFRNG